MIGGAAPILTPPLGATPGGPAPATAGDPPVAGFDAVMGALGSTLVAVGDMAAQGAARTEVGASEAISGAVVAPDVGDILGAMAATDATATVEGKGVSADGERPAAEPKAPGVAVVTVDDGKKENGAIIGADAGARPPVTVTRFAAMPMPGDSPANPEETETPSSRGKGADREEAAQGDAPAVAVAPAGAAIIVAGIVPADRPPVSPTIAAVPLPGSGMRPSPSPSPIMATPKDAANDMAANPSGEAADPLVSATASPVATKDAPAPLAGLPQTDPARSGDASTPLPVSSTLPLPTDSPKADQPGAVVVPPVAADAVDAAPVSNGTPRRESESAKAVAMTPQVSGDRPASSSGDSRPAPATVAATKSEAGGKDAAISPPAAPAAAPPQTAVALPVPPPFQPQAPTGPSVLPATDMAQVVMGHHLDLARDSAWLDQLARDIVSTAANDSQLRFKLNPEHLGSLHVELLRRDDGAAVRMTTESEAARAMLADAQGRLVAEARTHGMRITETSVDLSRNHNGGEGGQRGWGEASSGQSGQPNPQPRPRHVNASVTMSAVNGDRIEARAARRDLYA